MFDEGDRCGGVRPSSLPVCAAPLHGPPGWESPCGCWPDRGDPRFVVPAFNRREAFFAAAVQQAQRDFEADNANAQVGDLLGGSLVHLASCRHAAHSL